MIWSLAYVIFAVVGWRIIEMSGKAWAIWLWCVQAGLLWLWPTVFFGLHALALGLVLIAGLLVTGAAMAIASLFGRWRVWRWLAVYLVWIGYQCFLAYMIFRMN